MNINYILTNSQYTYKMTCCTLYVLLGLLTGFVAPSQTKNEMVSTTAVVSNYFLANSEPFCTFAFEYASINNDT